MKHNQPQNNNCESQMLGLINNQFKHQQIKDIFESALVISKTLFYCGLVVLIIVISAILTRGYFGG